MKLNKIRQIILLGYGVTIIILSVVCVPQKYMVPKERQIVRLGSVPDLMEVVEYHPLWASMPAYHYRKGIALSSLTAELISLTLVTGVIFILSKGSGD